MKERLKMYKSYISIYSLERLYDYIRLIKNDICNSYHLHIFANLENYFIVVCRYYKGQQIFIGGVILSKEDYNANKNKIEETDCFISIE